MLLPGSRLRNRTTEWVVLTWGAITQVLNGRSVLGAKWVKPAANLCLSAICQRRCAALTDGACSALSVDKPTQSGGVRIAA